MQSFLHEFCTTSNYEQCEFRNFRGMFQTILRKNDVRICQGCRTNFKCSDNIIPDPPLDIILGRVEKREISNPSGAKMLKETTSHYHASMACVKAVCPNFNPQENLVVPMAVKKKLNELHWYYIKEELKHVDKS